ncbi:hypothetical protein CEXT_732621 [Caerostris extrusa]|uniref:Uncharacterized protein n=1 Tax=Caerostris extrusa TaxID=172846 RepID=A0AAV4R0N1_CAEEX|nr:hypothetical protein CEXT_732621 [Caerostris extrusa]
MINCEIKSLRKDVVVNASNRNVEHEFGKSVFVERQTFGPDSFAIRTVVMQQMKLFPTEILGVYYKALTVIINLKEHPQRAFRPTVISGLSPHIDTTVLFSCLFSNLNPLVW